MKSILFLLACVSASIAGWNWPERPRTGRALAVASLILLLLSQGCTDTTVASIEAMGRLGHIRCWSGALLTYEGDSTGRIQTVSQSDGWEFKDAKTGKFVRVSGACVIEN